MKISFEELADIVIETTIETAEDMGSLIFATSKAVTLAAEIASFLKDNGDTLFSDGERARSLLMQSADREAVIEKLKARGWQTRDKNVAS